MKNISRNSHWFFVIGCFSIIISSLSISKAFASAKQINLPRIDWLYYYGDSYVLRGLPINFNDVSWVTSHGLAVNNTGDRVLHFGGYADWPVGVKLVGSPNFSLYPLSTSHPQWPNTQDGYLSLLRSDTGDQVISPLTTGGRGLDEVQSAVFDNRNNLIAVSSYDDIYSNPSTSYFVNTNFGLGGRQYLTISPDTSNIAITKLDSLGNFVWSRSPTPMLDGASLTVRDMAVDSQRNIVFVGDFSDTIDFDPGAGFDIRSSASNNGCFGTDIFVTKFDENGNYLWTITGGAAGRNDFAFGVDVSATGDVAVVGSMNGYSGVCLVSGGATFTNMAGQAASLGEEDVLLIHINSAGTAVQAVSAGSSQYDRGRDVKWVNGQIVLTGYFQGTGRFGTQVRTAIGVQDLFVGMYSSQSLNPLWVRSLGRANSGTRGDKIAANRCSEITVGVSRPATVTLLDFAPGSVAKFNASGNLLWDFPLPANTHDYSFSGLEIRNNGEIIASLTGSFLTPTTASLDGNIVTKLSDPACP